MARAMTDVHRKLQSLPVFAGCAQYDDGSSLLESVTMWMQSGVRTPLCIFNNGESAVFLGKDGEVVGIGKNSAQELGVGDSEPHPTPKETGLNLLLKTTSSGDKEQAKDLTPIKLLHCQDHTLVLTAQLQLMQLQGPERSPALQKPVVEVACGGSHYAAVTLDGEVFTCGSNSFGQLGVGTCAASTVPVKPKLQQPAPRERYALHVAAGSDHTVVVCEQEWIFTFGSNSHGQCATTSGTQGSPANAPGATNIVCSPASMQLPGSPRPRPVKVACGNLHTLFLTIDGQVFGCGNAQNGKLPGFTQATLIQPNRLTFDSSLCGLPVDIAAHNDASLILTEQDCFYVAGRVGTLFGSPNPVVDRFTAYSGDVVLVDNHVLYMKQATGQVRIPGFNDSSNARVCDIEIVSESTGAVSEAIHVGSQILHMRSGHLSRLLASPCKGGKRDASEDKVRLAIKDYSYDALYAYCQYLYTDTLECDPLVAVELLKLVDQYMDDTGLLGHCLGALRRSMGKCPTLLPATIKACIEIGHSAIAADLLRRGLSTANIFEVLRDVEEALTHGPESGDPKAQYVRELALAFAVEHSKDIIVDRSNPEEPKVFDGYKDIVPLTIKDDWLKKLALQGLLH